MFVFLDFLSLWVETLVYSPRRDPSEHLPMQRLHSKPALLVVLRASTRRPQIVLALPGTIARLTPVFLYVCTRSVRSSSKYCAYYPEVRPFLLMPPSQPCNIYRAPVQQRDHWLLC